MSKKKPSPKNGNLSRGRAQSRKPLDPPLPDRRALEGIMRQLVPGFADDDSEVDAAQQIIYEAFDETSPRRQMALARKAIEVSPDCADAYVLLAEYASSPAEELELFEQGVAAGERALGDKGFQEYEGHFWGYLPTRPYMRAREGLANCLWETGRREEAAEHCREMLRLNPNDNQGIRYRLAAMLLDLEEHDELERLLTQYKDDCSAEWAYTRALLAFRRGGDTPSARKLLMAAKKINAHVPDYLCRIKSLPRDAPEYITFGGEDEAVSYAAQFLPAWKETPGAAAWLRKTLKLSPDSGPAKKRQPWNRLQIALSRLPQREDETWELDTRQVVTPDSEMTSQWMLVALNTAGDKVIHFDFLDNRPKDGEAWNFLISALTAPQDDEAHRPAAIRVARKSWCSSWNRKLNEIGIECQHAESLAQLDRWYQVALPEFERAQQLADESSPADADWTNLASLPQRVDETWQADVQHLPVWVDKEEGPARPWVGLVVDARSEVILSSAMATNESPDNLLAKAIWQALNSPAAGDSYRPGTIHVASDRQCEILAAHLEQIGVRCAVDSNMERLGALFGELATHLGGPQQRGALIQSPGVTAAQLGGLFEAAALFYRARPWRKIPGDSVIRVSCERFDSGPWYVVVMGQSGIEQGIAIYEDLELLRRQLQGSLSDDEAGRRMSATSLTYGEPFEVAPEDLDAAEKFGWPVAGPEAYPCVLRVNPGMALRTPLKWELELLEGCLRAIPEFLGERHKRADIAVELAGTKATFRLDVMEDLG